MIIIAGNSHIKLATSIATSLNIKLILANTQKFEDQELRVQIDDDLYEKDIFIVQSTSKPANDHLIELLLIADTAKRAGAKKIVAIIPYFGYGRQDRPSYKYGPISANLIATLIEASKIDKIITIDLHSKQSEGFFKIGVENIDPSLLFLPLFENRNNSIVVSPDIGGLYKAQRFSRLLKTDLAIINKNRNSDGMCIMDEVIGNIKGKNSIIIDDIIDTGETICKASELLLKEGAKSVSACVTHAVFSSDCLEKIESSNFKEFYITDTIYHNNLQKNFQVISSDILIIESLKKFIMKK